MAQFGYAVVSAVSQSPVHGPGHCFIEQSSVFIVADYFDLTRQPYLPNAVQYRVDDLTSGDSIAPWTAVQVSISTQVTITPEQNALISSSRLHECHQVLIAISDDEGVNYARVVFDLIRVVGL